MPGAPGDAAAIDAYVAKVGRMPAVLSWYESWAGEPEFPSAHASAVVGRGATPMITWEPWNPSAVVSQPDHALRFDELKETDWRVDSSPRSLATFAEVAKTAAYAGKLPPW